MSFILKTTIAGLYLLIMPYLVIHIWRLVNIFKRIRLLNKYIFILENGTKEEIKDFQEKNPYADFEYRMFIFDITH